MLVLGHFCIVQSSLGSLYVQIQQLFLSAMEAGAHCLNLGVQGSGQVQISSYKVKYFVWSHLAHSEHSETLPPSN